MSAVGLTMGSKLTMQNRQSAVITTSTVELQANIETKHFLGASPGSPPGPDFSGVPSCRVPPQDRLRRPFNP